MNREELRRQISHFPPSPGVYLMKDRQEAIIYVGKAKNLKNRVSSYFSGTKDRKTAILVSKVRVIETIVTQTEYEALLLENTLIKKWNPRYNINLKDGKTYPVIRITSEPFPRIYRTRRIIQDGSTYYGPYPSSAVLDAYLELVNRLYPLRQCRGKLKKRTTPCLYHHIGRCSAPCAGKISQEDYNLRVEQIKTLLDGDSAQVEARVTAEMTQAAAELRFEKAAELRDALESIRQVATEQKVVDFEEEKRDYVAFVREEDLYTFTVFQMRGGRLTGRDLYRTESPVDEEEALSLFLLRYYSESPDPPSRLYLPIPLETGLLTEFFLKEKHTAVDISSGEADKRAGAVLGMALENARQDMDRRRRSRENRDALEALQEALSLPRLPRRIEGFDIAQLDGKFPVASLVSFWNGKPDKKNYRSFRLKTTEGMVDDYESIREAVARRYTRILNEGGEAPDFILIDGGKGQVRAAREILDALGFARIPLAGLAKREEEVFLPGQSKPVILPVGSEPLKLLQAVRDETHRFATSLNQRLRLKEVKAETLESVPGIGPARSRKLLEAFGSLDALKGAAAAEVAKKGGLPLDLARDVLEALGSADPTYRHLRGDQL